MIQFTSCLSFAFQSRRLVGRILGGSEVQRTTIELVNHLDGFEATKNIKVRCCPLILLLVNIGFEIFFSWEKCLTGPSSILLMSPRKNIKRIRLFPHCRWSWLPTVSTSSTRPLGRIDRKIEFDEFPTRRPAPISSRLSLSMINSFINCIILDVRVEMLRPGD